MQNEDHCILREDIIEYAQRCVGVPYMHAGRSIHGMDCIGLLCYIADMIGYQHHGNQFRAYEPTPDGVTLERELCSVFDRIDRDETMPGDVLVFRIGRYPRHVGILLPHDQLIHTYSGVGRVVRHILAEPWVSRINDWCLRFRGVNVWQPSH